MKNSNEKMNRSMTIVKLLKKVVAVATISLGLKWMKLLVQLRVYRDVACLGLLLLVLWVRRLRLMLGTGSVQGIQ